MASKKENDAIIEKAPLFIAGKIEGVRLYAWWKDGVQYVGTCGTTLTEAIERIKKGED